MASSELTWHTAALAEAEEARNWYAAHSPLAARGFLLALEEAVSAVIEAPERWPKHLHGCRRHVFPNHYPYTLIYRLAEDLEIVAVAHHKRRPGYWRRRL